MFGARSQLWHTSKLQTGILVFKYGRLWNDMSRRPNRIIEHLAMGMIRNGRQLVKDDSHHFLQDFANRNKVAHRLTISAIFRLHSAESNLSLHLGCPHERSSTASNHISSTGLDTTRVLLVFNREQTTKVGIDVTINPQFFARFQNQAMSFCFLQSVLLQLGSYFHRQAPCVNRSA